MDRWSALEDVEPRVIEIVCDNCERPFEVAAELAGGKAPCPRCGDVNRVPPPPADRADLPPHAGPEREICVVRPGMFRAHPFRYLAIAVLVLGGLGGAIAAPLLSSVPGWTAWPALVLGIAGLGWFGWWWASTHWWIKLIVSNKRTVRHEGVVRRHTTEVLHDHVRSVDIDQTFLQRLLGVGTIGIDSAGQDRIEIQARDIPRPYEIKKIIDTYRAM